MAAFKKVVFLAFICVVFNCSFAFKFTEDDATDDNMVDDIVERIMNENDNQPAAAVEKRTLNQQCNDHLKFPESANIVIENNNKNVNAMNDIPNCDPRKFAVNIPVPSHWDIYPTAVNLKRCYGSVFSSSEECIASKKEKVRVSYYRINGGSYVPELVDMWEHTECQIACKVKPADCTANQTYDQNQCDCICSLPSNTTCEGDRIFDPHKCECKCRIPKSCGVYLEWDPKSCSCTCAKCLRDICTKHNMIINEQTCQCQ